MNLLPAKAGPRVICCSCSTALVPGTSLCLCYFPEKLRERDERRQEIFWRRAYTRVSEVECDSCGEYHTLRWDDGQGFEKGKCED
jgi:hypothetical protein